MSQEGLFPENEFHMAAQSPLSRLGREEQIEEMKKWFFQHYTDPAQNTPYDSSEGGYQYIWGGPYDAREELESEYGGIVPEDVIEDLAEELNDISYEWAGNADEQAIDDYEFELARSTEHLASFDAAVTVIQAILLSKFPDELLQALWRQQYASVFFALEAYLFDFFYSVIQKDRLLFRKFVSVNKDFQKTTLKLSQIIDEHEKLEQTVREHLAGLSWHNLPRVAPIYRETLGIEFDKEVLGQLSKAVLTRHDIVHRNGKKIDNTEVVLSKEQLWNLISLASRFVERIESEWRRIDRDPTGTVESSDF